MNRREGCHRRRHRGDMFRRRVFFLAHTHHTEGRGCAAAGHRRKALTSLVATRAEAACSAQAVGGGRFSEASFPRQNNLYQR